MLVLSCIYSIYFIKIFKQSKGKHPPEYYTNGLKEYIDNLLNPKSTLVR